MQRLRLSNEVPRLPRPVLLVVAAVVAFLANAGMTASFVFGQFGIAAVNAVLLVGCLGLLAVHGYAWRWWLADRELLALHREFRAVLLALPVDSWHRSTAGGGATFMRYSTPGQGSWRTPALHRLIRLRDEQHTAMHQALRQGQLAVTVTDEFVIGRRDMPVILRHQQSMQEPGPAGPVLTFVDDDRPLEQRREANVELLRAGVLYPSSQELRAAIEQIRTAAPL